VRRCNTTFTNCYRRLRHSRSVELSCCYNFSSSSSSAPVDGLSAPVDGLPAPVQHQLLLPCDLTSLIAGSVASLSIMMSFHVIIDIAALVGCVVQR